MSNFKVTGLKEAESMRKKYNLTPIEALDNGIFQPKTYVFAESEEEVNELMGDGEKEINKRGRPRKEG